MKTATGSVGAGIRPWGGNCSFHYGVGNLDFHLDYFTIDPSNKKLVKFKKGDLLIIAD